MVASVSVEEGLPGFDDSYSMIGVCVVHVRDFVPWHVTRHTIFFADRARGPGLLCRGLALLGTGMATEAAAVISPSLTHQRLMRIVTAGARKARISLTPTTAALQAVGLEAHVGNPGGANALCVPPGRVACATEVNEVYRFQVFRIHDGGRARIQISRLHGGHMPGARPVATLA